MTLEEITADIDKLEKMSDAELLEYFKPMLCVTRPEIANPTGEKKHQTVQGSLKGFQQSAQFKQAQQLAAKFGVKI